MIADVPQTLPDFHPVEPYPLLQSTQTSSLMPNLASESNIQVESLLQEINRLHAIAENRDSEMRQLKLQVDQLKSKLLINERELENEKANMKHVYFENTNLREEKQKLSETLRSHGISDTVERKNDKIAYDDLLRKHSNTKTSTNSFVNNSDFLHFLGKINLG